MEYAWNHGGDDGVEVLEVNQRSEDQSRQRDMKLAQDIFEGMSNKQVLNVVDQMAQMSIGEDDLQYPELILNIALNTTAGVGNIEPAQEQQQLIHHAIHLWQHELSMASKTLRFNRATPRGETIPLGYAGQLSLVAHDNKPVYVNWTVPSQRKGRVARVDGSNIILSTVAAIDPVVDFKDCDILHPAISLYPRRAKGTGRPKIPDTVLTFHRMCRI